MQLAAPFVLPLKISSIPVASSRGHLTKRRLAGGAGDAVMTAAGRKEKGGGRGRVLTSQRPIFSHCQKGLRQSVGRRGHSPLWEKDGRDAMEGGWNGGWDRRTDGWIDGKSLCPVAFPGRRRRTRIKKCCAQICFHSRGRVSSGESGEGRNRFQMERVRIWESRRLLEIR